MARKPLRSQLNQIRAWVRQGRTDAWIAHQLEVSASELREFRRRHELAPGDEGEDDELDLRDEIEAEIEAATREEEEEEAAEAAAREPEAVAPPEGEGKAAEDEEAGDEERPRRRRRRGGRGRGRRRAPGSLQATFDHGEEDGYGLWLDPAVAEDPVYTEHWAGHRKVEVTVEPDQIVIKRS
jgi:hypothetical protein